MAEDINKIFADIEKELDGLLASEEKSLLAAIKKLERKILDDLVKFRGTQDQVAAKNSLAAAVAYQKQLIQAVSNEYGQAYERYVKNLDRVTGLVEKEYGALGVPLEYSSVDRATFASLRTAINAEFAAMGDYIVNEITGPVYDSVLAGGSFKQLSDQIEKLLYADGEGRFAYMAERKAHDTLMSYSANTHLAAAKRTGITDFLYYGNVIKTTRPFCAVRAGKIYGIKEIQTWNELTWKGKKPGPVMVNRGGYNCRHTFHPVKKRWIKEGRLNPQRWGNT